MVVSFLLNLVNTFGYLGVFLVSIIGSLSLFIPLPYFIVVMAAGAILNPIMVGVVAGLGAAIGELFGYGIGVGIHFGHKRIAKKHTKKELKKEKTWMTTIRKWFHKKLGPLVIFAFAVTPLPDKIIGIFCGAVRYDIKKFFIFMLIGKIILSVVIAYAGFYGLQFVEGFL